jgi:spermidine synthase
VLFLIFFGGLIIAPRIEKWSLSKNYPYCEIIDEMNTHYSNIVILRRVDQRIFMVDGLPAIILPNPDPMAFEEFIDLPLLLHPMPKEILILGSKVWEALNEFKKHNIQTISYIEEDADLIRAIKKYSTLETNGETNLPELQVINTDARRYLKLTSKKYDVIFILEAVPLTLESNRYFTKEFFELCKRKLTDEGILVTFTPGSFTYLSEPLKKVIGSHLNTLRSIFEKTDLLLGEHIVYFSYKKTKRIPINSDTLCERLYRRNIRLSLLNDNYLTFRLNYLYSDQEFINAFNLSPPIVNQDLHPRGLFYNIAYYNIVSLPWLITLVKIIEKINLLYILGLISLVTAFFLVFKHKGSTVSISFSIFSTGFSAMIITLVVSFAFQIYFGNLYYQVNFLLTTFIVGIVIGALLSSKIKFSPKKELVIIEGLMIVFLSLLSIGLGLFFNKDLTMGAFFIALLLSGILVGFEFPVACKLAEAILECDVKRNIGKLYAYDLLGGCLGAFMGTLVLLPMLGILSTVILILFLKVISFFFILTI